MSTALDRLPEPIARAVRMAFVPPETRALLARLPVTLQLRAAVPADGSVPSALAQLIKAASLGRAIESVVVLGPVAATLAYAERVRVITPHELEGELAPLLRAVLPALLPAEVFITALETFAAHAAKLAALRDLTAHMLRARDVDLVVHAMLSGISSGHGLGFHRVALFQLDETRGAYAGTRAIGPADAPEAHRIWEALEYEDTGLDGLLSDHARRDVDGRFERAVQAIALTAGTDPKDEIRRALASDAPLSFAGHALVNSSLAALAPADDFVVAAIRPHGQVRGLLFADDKYGAGPLEPERVALLAGFLEPMALVWENLTLLRRVEELARFDGLTALLTRRAFDERLAAELERARASATPLSFIAIDVDHFKHTNDTRGHAAGDALLRALGAILLQHLRSDDIPGRLGGDEFAVILPACALEDCVVVARRIGASAAACGISLSMGAACFPADCPGPEALATLADERLYAAKRAGRGHACFGTRVVRFDA